MVTFSLNSGGIVISNEIEIQPYKSAIHLSRVILAQEPLVEGNTSVTIFGSGFEFGIQYFVLLGTI